MRGLLLVLMLSLVCTVLNGASTAWKHPGVAHPPKLKLEAVYVPDGTDAAISRGDITFTANKTPLSSLSLEEIFIVAGAKVSDLPDGRSLDPWASLIFRMLLAYHNEHGALPAVLDEAAIRSVPYYRHSSAAEIDVYRSPFTGAWPRLSAAEHSPGDIYTRVLSDAEKAEYARILGRWEAWFGQGSGQQLCSPVFYLRIYGKDGPIYESLPHATCPSK